MTVTEDVVLKPIDERWMLRALRFVDRFSRTNGHGPTWGELFKHMGWPRKSCSAWFRMQKLRKRGLEWDEDGERSLRLTEAGAEQLKATE